LIFKDNLQTFKDRPLSPPKMDHQNKVLPKLPMINNPLQAYRRMQAVPVHCRGSHPGILSKFWSKNTHI